jgi:hypothetical protein
MRRRMVSVEVANLREHCWFEILENIEKFEKLKI